MKTYTEMVTEFHERNGSVIAGVNNGPEVALLRISLIIEELGETLAAMRDNDVVEAADGLTDLLYVIAGTAVSYGTSVPEDTLPPIGEVVTEFDPDAVMMFARKTIEGIALLAVKLAMDTDAKPHVALTVSHLWRSVAAFGAGVFGFPVDALFREVHRSNMTKTFAGAKNTSGGKYPAGATAKGPGYEPPNIAAVLGLQA